MSDNISDAAKAKERAEVLSKRSLNTLADAVSDVTAFGYRSSSLVEHFRKFVSDLQARVETLTKERDTAYIEVERLKEVLGKLQIRLACSACNANLDLIKSALNPTTPAP